MSYGQPEAVTHPDTVLLVLIALSGSEVADAFESLPVHENIHKQLIGLKEFKQLLEIDNGGMYNKAVIVTVGNVVNQIGTSGFQNTINMRFTTANFDRYIQVAKDLLEK